MMSLFRIAAGLCAATVLSAPAYARDLAVVLSNPRYPNLSLTSSTAPVDHLIDTLAVRGFEVEVIDNARAPAYWAALRALATDMADADRLLIVMHGAMATTGRESWLLGRQAGAVDAFSVGASGVRVGAVLDLLASRPGRSVLVMADIGQGEPLGAGLSGGPGSVAVPHGVTLVSGPAVDVLNFTFESVLMPGQNLDYAMQSAPAGVVMRGFIPAGQPFIEAQRDNDWLGDEALWRSVAVIGTVEALETYLERHPDGDHAAEARQRIAELHEADRLAAARATEADLDLSEGARQDIQRDLSILGYDTGGIDGVFGRGTRTAIANWQRTAGAPVSGYVSGKQITQLKGQAAQRAAELEELDRLRREALEQRDRAFWASTGAGKTEAGILSYLARYPDGLFEERAQVRLGEIAQAKNKRAKAKDRAAWDKATKANSRKAYWGYLREHPKGEYAAMARNRIDQLRRAEENQKIAKAAKAQEKGLLKSPLLRLSVEQRLSQMKLNPGKVDGTIDAKTRGALRRFQRQADLAVTGYVNRPTLTRLLAVTRNK